MEIGPITAVRPVTMIKSPRGAPDLSRVFEVEYLGQPGDEYTPANGKAERGLEDEEDAAEEPEDAGRAAEDVPHSIKVNLFA
jgi:hypothetical protein